MPSKKFARESADSFAASREIKQIVSAYFKKDASNNYSPNYPPFLNLHRRSSQRIWCEGIDAKIAGSPAVRMEQILRQWAPHAKKEERARKEITAR